MAQDGLDDLLRIAFLAQHGGAHERMLVKRRVLLVVHVVEQARQAPLFDILIKFLSIIFHGRLDGIGVAAQALGLRPFVEKC